MYVDKSPENRIIIQSRIRIPQCGREFLLKYQYDMLLTLLGIFILFVFYSPDGFSERKINR